jgi:hypothetical protein
MAGADWVRARLAAPRRPSILPETVEALGIHLRIAGRVGDLAMPEIGGQSACIDPIVDQLEAARMTQ